MKAKNTISTFLLILTMLHAGFLLKNAGGEIAIWDMAAKSRNLTGRRIETFPNACDREMLQNGIYLPNEQALTKAMEDFCS